MVLPGLDLALEVPGPVVVRSQMILLGDFRIELLGYRFSHPYDPYRPPEPKPDPAAVAGLGLAQVFEGLARPDLAAKRLVRVLPAYAAPFPGFSAYYPSRAHLPARVRAGPLPDRRVVWNQIAPAASCVGSPDDLPRPPRRHLPIRRRRADHQDRRVRS